MKKRILIFLLILGVIGTLFVLYDFEDRDLDGEVLVEAYYEAQIGSSILKFRDNNRFDMINRLFFSTEKGACGFYYINGDTLFLKFETKRPVMLSDTLFVKKDYLYRPLREGEQEIIRDTLVITHFKVLFNKLD